MKKTFLIVSFLTISTNLISQVIYSNDNPPPKNYPYHNVFIIKNNNRDNHTITFTSPAQSFKNMMQDRGKLETNKVLHFSSNYKIDSSFIKQGISNLKASLPKNFWNFSMWGIFYDNEPNQDSIWFIYLFVETDKNNNIKKVFSAYKVTFEGKDATDVKQRIDPKIINLEFIFDKKKLKLLETQLKTLPKSS